MNPSWGYDEAGMGSWKDNKFVGVYFRCTLHKLQSSMGWQGGWWWHVPPLDSECSFTFSGIKLRIGSCHAHSPSKIAHHHQRRRRHLPEIPFDLVIITVQSGADYLNLTRERGRFCRFLRFLRFLVSSCFPIPFSGIFARQGGTRTSVPSRTMQIADVKLQSHVPCQ